MKFTEALLIGSMNTKQGFTFGNDKSRCALETAVETELGTERYNNDLCFGWQESWVLWPWLQHKANHPITKQEWCIAQIIYSLNDTYHWPRPRIAEWAKQYEDLYDPSTTTSEVTTEVMTTTVDTLIP